MLLFPVYDFKLLNKQVITVWYGKYDKLSKVVLQMSTGYPVGA